MDEDMNALDALIASANSNEYREFKNGDVIDRTCWTAPVFSNGKLYIRNVNGDLKCISIL